MSTIMGSMTNIGSMCNWEIEHFSDIQADTGTAIHSPIFSTTHSSGKALQWRLQLYPNGQHADSRSYVSVFLQNMSETEVSTMFSVSVVVDSDIEIFKQKTISPKYMRHKSCWGWLNYQKRVLFTDKNIRVLLNDTLTLCCSIYSTNVTDTVARTFTEDESSKVMNHFERLLETGDLSDVTFLIGDKSLKLHKAILGSLSPVFHSWFNDKTNSVKQVKINTDLSYEVMKEMFRYVYARKVNNIKCIAGDLFVAADKYRIEGLKVLCDETLCSDLNTDNALTRFELAVKYDMVQLKPVVTDFIVKKLKYFLDREQFKQLSSDCKDILLSLVANKLENEL